MDWARSPNGVATLGGTRGAAQVAGTRRPRPRVPRLPKRLLRQDCLGALSREAHPAGVVLESGVPEYGNAQDVRDKLAVIGEDILVDRPASEYKDVVVSMGIPSASWNATGGGSPVQGSDLNRCSRPPNLEGETLCRAWRAGEVAVLIHRYDETFERGGAGSWEGMEVVLEAESARPIREMEIYLEDGSPRFACSSQRSGWQIVTARGFKPTSTAPGRWSCAPRMSGRLGRGARRDAGDRDVDFLS